MSAIVINKDSGIPGPGYFDYFYGINRLKDFLHEVRIRCCFYHKNVLCKEK